jgi:hypothetical protein
MPPWNNNQKRNKSWHSDGIISTLSLVLHTICDNINFARIITGNFFFWCLPARDIRFVGANVVCVCSRREREIDKLYLLYIHYILIHSLSIYRESPRGKIRKCIYPRQLCVCVYSYSVVLCLLYTHIQIRRWDILYRWHVQVTGCAVCVCIKRKKDRKSSLFIFIQRFFFDMWYILARGGWRTKHHITDSLPGAWWQESEERAAMQSGCGIRPKSFGGFRCVVSNY